MNLLQRFEKLGTQGRALLRTVAVAAAIVAAAMACRRFVYTTDNVYAEKLANYVRILLYLGLFAAWGVSVRRRVVQLQVRGCLIAVSALFVSWLTLREFRWHLIMDPTTLRLLWYAYQIFSLMIPLLALFVSLSLGKPESYRLPRRTALLYIPAAGLILLTLTNDLHQLVYRFPADAAVWSEQAYRYGPGYYLAAGWGVLCAVAAFAIMLTKCRLPRTGKILWLPLVPFAAAVLYVVLYAARAPFLHSVLDDVTVSECLLFAAFFESCIQCGLIPSNTRYSDLFRASAGTSAQITHNGYTVRYAARGAEPLDRADMLRAEAGPVILESKKRLHNMAIAGGHVVWTEDISRLLRLRAELEGIQEELSDRNEIVRMEYLSEKERKTLEEQNRLYDLMQQKTQTQLDRVKALAAAWQRTEDEAEKRRILARIVVLGSFIKRRKDFVLSMETAAAMTGSALQGALQESLRSAELLGVRGSCLVLTDRARFPGEVLARAYDFFEDVMEALPETARELHVRFGPVGGTLRCAVLTDAAADDSAALGRKYPEMQEVRDEDGAEYILPLGPADGKGGERA